MAQEYGERVIRMLGDGAMSYFSEPAAVVLAGLDLIRRAGDAANPLVLRRSDPLPHSAAASRGG